MWKEITTDKLLFSKGDQSLHPSLFLFDLQALISKMKLKDSWERGDLDTTILLKTPSKKIVLVALHADTEIRSFQSNESVIFKIIEGRIKFHTYQGTIILERDQMLNLSENINYRLTTDVKTVVLITITNDSE